MMLDTTALWRQASEYLSPWARVTLVPSLVIGEGLHQLANMMHPPIDYAAVSQLGWPIFGMFIAFPPTFIWRFVSRRLLGEADTYELARQYILIIKMAHKEAGLSKMEQQFQWRAVMQKLASEISVGSKPPSTYDARQAVLRGANQKPKA